MDMHGNDLCYCLEFFDQNNTIGTNSFGGHGLSINLASTGSVTSVCATDPNPKQGGQSVHVKGIKCNSTAAGATVTNAAFEWQKTFDGAGAAEIEAQNNTTYALWLHGSGYFYNMHGSSYPQSGSQPARLRGWRCEWNWKWISNHQ